MKFTKKKETEKKSDALELAKKYEAWVKDPNHSYKNDPLVEHTTEEERYLIDAYREKRKVIEDKIYTFFSTLRDIILTPLAPIFGILSVIAKGIMYIGAFTFLYACYKVYKNMSAGDTIVNVFVDEWIYFTIPFIAAFLYFVFDKVAEYCSDHSIY